MSKKDPKYVVMTEYDEIVSNHDTLEKAIAAAKSAVIDDDFEELVIMERVKLIKLSSEPCVVIDL